MLDSEPVDAWRFPHERTHAINNVNPTRRRSARVVVLGAADGGPIAMHADQIQRCIIAVLTAVETAVLTAVETAMGLTMMVADATPLGSLCPRCRQRRIAKKHYQFFLCYPRPNSHSGEAVKRTRSAHDCFGYFELDEVSAPVP
jgi:hypothetical protein